VTADFGSDDPPRLFAKNDRHHMSVNDVNVVASQRIAGEESGKCSKEVVHKTFRIVATFTRFDFQNDFGCVVQLLAKDRPTRFWLS
jgi:hypothetical protein